MTVATPQAGLVRSPSTGPTTSDPDVVPSTFRAVMEAFRGAGILPPVDLKVSVTRQRTPDLPPIAAGQAAATPPAGYTTIRSIRRATRHLAPHRSTAMAGDRPVATDPVALHTLISSNMKLFRPEDPRVESDWDLPALLVEHYKHHPECSDDCYIHSIRGLLAHGLHIAEPEQSDGKAPVEQYALSPEDTELLRQETQEQLGRRAVTVLEAGQPLRSPAFVVNKIVSDPTRPSGQRTKSRVCVDYTASGLNDSLPDLPFAYAKLEDLTRKVRRNSHLNKWDLRKGYEQVPVAIPSQHLLAFKIPGDTKTYQYTRVPFGLKVAPAIFSLLTAELRLIADHSVRELRLAARSFSSVYLDDFAQVVTGPRRHAQAAHIAFEAALLRVGARIAEDKTEGPVQTMEYLGILIDARRMSLSITDRRRASLVASITAVIESCRPRRQTLRKLLGKLSFAAAVVRHGQSRLTELVLFTRRGSDAPTPKHKPLLNKELEWWRSRLAGTLPPAQIKPAPPRNLLEPSFSDASGLGGMGGHTWVNGLGTLEFHMRVPAPIKELDAMPLLELYAMVVGVVAKTSLMSPPHGDEGGPVRAHSLLHPIVDCQPVWLASIKGRAPRFRSLRASRTASALWSLALEHADKAQTALVPWWVPRTQLEHADALSRGRTLAGMAVHSC